MDTELELMASYVSKLKFILQEEQPELHTATLLSSLGSSNQDERYGHSAGENRMETRIRKKRKYQVLTAQQRDRLNCAFQSCLHPDQNAIEELANELNMSPDRVRYWFQNHKTQMKRFKNNEERNLLQKENEDLKEENAELRNRMRNLTCHTCGLPLFHKDCCHLENAMLKGELKCKHGSASTLIPQGVSSLLPSSSGLIAPGSNLGSNAVLVPESVMPSSVSQPAPALPNANWPILHKLSGNPNDGYGERDILFDLANRAVIEFITVMEDEALWLPNMDILAVESLNYQKYLAKSMTIGLKPVNFKVDATRDTAIVKGSCADLVKGLSDVNWWRELFPGIVASANTTRIISTGHSNSCDGLLQLMHAELQVMSPEIPVGDVTFLRQCVQNGTGLWYVVDVSINSVLGKSKSSQHSVQSTRTTERHMEVRFLPSGCIIQEMGNGYSKVNWMVHAVYDERVIQELHWPLLRSGKALGACRWVASLQRHSQFFSSLCNSIPCPGSTVKEMLWRRNALHLVKQMTSSFTALCASMSKAMLQDVDVTQFANQIIGGATGEPVGQLLSATTTIWLPGVKPRHVYDYLHDEQCLVEWRYLFGDQLLQGNALPYGAPRNGEAVQKFYRMVNGLHEGHAISLINPREIDGSISSTLLLQEARTDLSGSLIVYAGIDVNTMHSIMTGDLDPATVFLVSSGCVILPDCLDSCPLLPPPTADQASSSSSAGIASRSRTGGSFVTVAYQMFVSSQSSGGSSINQGHDALKNATNMFKASLETPILA
ncbi:homeobox-leucine zipper protein ROC6-like [Oryza brachyantha]|uniref:Homeobox domain-containing protein n=1 Tax=Oryza brachyantha TaxID=4533 RepID=J3MRW7_ORYBR|nr:homeobox-leucine zipper protein ROC6-like [Oryza brachyantha]XP_015695445.1 homeobox-leucine zipper protein ROC6-like [Oryza brachyantha]XP_015695446.1 homeobox-leucine zipper protein ROC6-like [Oryza brachyantha]